MHARAVPHLFAAWPMAVLVTLVAVYQAATVGFAPTSQALILAGGDLASPLAPPRAFCLHAGPAHALSNAALLLLFAVLWVRLAALDDARRRAIGGPVALVVIGGTFALGLAAAIDGAPRVGASGGVHALLASLPTLAILRRHALPAGTRRIVPVALAGLALLLLALGAVVPVGVDALSHVLGFALGVPLTFVALRPRLSLALNATAAAWMAAAVVVG